MNGSRYTAGGSLPPMVLKSPEDIERMREAGRLVHAVLDFIAPWIRPGISTDRLDRLCHAHIVDDLHAEPAYLGHAPGTQLPFPKSIFTSVNHHVCHGMPDGRALENGDLLGIDVAIAKDGYHAGASRMFHVGGATTPGIRLSDAARACLEHAIAMIGPGVALDDLGAAIEKRAQELGYGVVRAFCGHGIGKSLLELPYVPNFRKPQAGAMLRPGMTLAIAPMLLSGRADLCVLDDGWTVAARDCCLAAQWKDTVLVTETGYEVLTRPSTTGVPVQS